MKITQLTPQERPRERCHRLGPHTLSTAECLALVIGQGPHNRSCLEVARELLARYQTPDRDGAWAFFQALHHETLQLEQIKGIGPAISAKLLACFEIAKRYGQHLNEPRQTGPLKKADLPLRFLRKIPVDLRFATSEWFGIIPLLAGNHIGEFCLIERGVRTHVHFDPSVLFAKVLALRPRAICLAHNHPSGDPTASVVDVEMTQTVAQMAGLFSIDVPGHWVVAQSRQEWINPNLEFGPS